MNILLVEPDRVLRQSYRRALEQAAHTVCSESNAQAAVGALDGQPVDVIILEIQMAAHNGIEFLHELRSYPEWGHIPVVLHTVLPAIDPNTMQHLGVVQYLYKPQTSLAHLVQAVNRLAIATKST